MHNGLYGYIKVTQSYLYLILSTFCFQLKVLYIREKAFYFVDNALEGFAYHQIYIDLKVPRSPCPNFTKIMNGHFIFSVQIVDH